MLSVLRVVVSHLADPTLEMMILMDDRHLPSSKAEQRVQDCMPEGP